MAIIKQISLVVHILFTEAIINKSISSFSFALFIAALPESPINCICGNIEISFKYALKRKLFSFFCEISNFEFRISRLLLLYSPRVYKLRLNVIFLSLTSLSTSFFNFLSFTLTPRYFFIVLKFIGYEKK